MTGNNFPRALPMRLVLARLTVVMTPHTYGVRVAPPSSCMPKPSALSAPELRDYHTSYLSKPPNLRRTKCLISCDSFDVILQSSDVPL